MSPYVHASPEQPFPSPEALSASVQHALPDFGSVAWLAQTGSTNADLVAQAKAAFRLETSETPHSDLAPAPWLRGAHLQTTGKGRAGRPWQNQAGNCLMFSCAFEAQIPVAQLPGIGPALGVATCLALRGLLKASLPGESFSPLTLKWPNDLQWGQAKLAGLLIETAPAKTRTGHPMVVIGMGLNLSGAQTLSAQLERPIADLCQIYADTHATASLEPALIVSCLARAWQHALHDYALNGYAVFCSAFNDVDALAGQIVQVIDQGAVLHEGLAQGTDRQGRLCIQTETGMMPVLVGDVSIRPLK